MLALHNLAQIARLRREGMVAAIRTEEALTLARELGDASQVASGLTALGHTMIDSGTLGRAVPLFVESLDLAHGRGNLGDVIDALEGLARVGAETGRAERSARLFGAAATLRDAVGVPRSPSDVTYFEPAMQVLRGALGEKNFAAATALGRNLTRDEAMAEAGALASEIAAPVAGGDAGEPTILSCLTRREREVLRLVAEGLSDKEIGAALAISAQTATKHVGNVLRKLGVSSRTAAATLAMRQGLVSSKAGEGAVAAGPVQ
jgi:DNA-binding CsgD family transcriptional regulator